MVQNISIIISGKFQDPSSQACLWNLFPHSASALHNLQSREWGEEARTSGERDKNTEREDFCSEDPHLHHHQGCSHLQDRGEGRQEKFTEERLTWWEDEKYLPPCLWQTTGPKLLADDETCNHRYSTYSQVPTVFGQWNSGLTVDSGHYDISYLSNKEFNVLISY